MTVLRHVAPPQYPCRLELPFLAKPRLDALVALPVILHPGQRALPFSLCVLPRTTVDSVHVGNPAGGDVIHPSVGQTIIADGPGKDVCRNVCPERIQEVLAHKTKVAGVLEQGRSCRDGSPRTTLIRQSGDPAEQKYCLQGEPSHAVFGIIFCE